MDNNETDWPCETRENKPWTRWWWLGSAVDRENLKRSLRELFEAGIGGVEITPIYGVPGYEKRFIKYLSPDWMDILAFAVTEAESRGMGVDMPTCTGWPFGGPDIPPADSDSILEMRDDKLICKPSGFKVKRAAPGGEGPVLNPYSPGAIRRYLKRFDNAFSTFHAPLPRSFFHDSFEYEANCFQGFASEFRKRCGYELQDYAKALMGKGDIETVSRVRADYRRMISDLHLRYIQVWTEWAHGRKSMSRNQAHGAPGNLLDLYAAADIPETETHGSSVFRIPGLHRNPELVLKSVPNPQTAKFASSAAHIGGKKLASCETFTWLMEHFNTSLAQMKPELDQVFLNGINHVIYHGTCYSPSDAKWPGWVFYASEQLNPRNSIWRDFPELNRYVTRCQSILQSGEPDNDLLLYWPFEDVIHKPGIKICERHTMRHHRKWLTGTPFGDLALSLDKMGYSCDYVSDRQTGELTVSDGILMTPASGKFKAILVPECEHMPLETLEKLLALSKAGATVVFHSSLPYDVPGLFKLEERRKILLQMKSRINPALKRAGGSAKFGKGRIMLGKNIKELLDIAKIARETIVDDGIRFIRRRHETGMHYFMACLGGKGFDGWAKLSCGLRSALIMDPLTGKTGVAKIRRSGSKSEIRMQLKPGQSLIIRTFTKKTISGTPWHISEPKGKAMALNGKWDVTFIDGGPKMPKPCSIRKLVSWTKFGDKACECFGGTATYRTEFEWKIKSKSEQCLLQLGDVRESAKVFINGNLAGTAWSLPFEVQVGGFMKDGLNILEIEVTNLSANRIRDMDIRGVPWKKMGDINIVSVNSLDKLDASVWPLCESGLLGPVRLRRV